MTVAQLERRLRELRLAGRGEQPVYLGLADGDVEQWEVWAEAECVVLGEEREG